MLSHKSPCVFRRTDKFSYNPLVRIRERLNLLLPKEMWDLSLEVLRPRMEEHSTSEEIVTCGVAF